MLNGHNSADMVRQLLAVLLVTTGSVAAVLSARDVLWTSEWRWWPHRLRLAVEALALAIVAGAGGAWLAGGWTLPRPMVAALVVLATGALALRVMDIAEDRATPGVSRRAEDRGA